LLPGDEKAHGRERLTAQFWVRGEGVRLHGGSEGFRFGAAGCYQVDGGLGYVWVGRGGEGAQDLEG
jgi:hypothetical protein